MGWRSISPAVLAFVLGCCMPAWAEEPELLPVGERPQPVQSPPSGIQPTPAAPHEIRVRLGGPGIEIVDEEGRGATVIATLPFPGKLYQVLQRGKVVYVTGDRVGASVVDISNPRAPRDLGIFASGAVVNLELHGQNLHLLRADGSVTIYDIRTPSRPELLAVTMPHGDQVTPSRPKRPARDRAVAQTVVGIVFTAVALPLLAAGIGLVSNPGPADCVDCGIVVLAYGPLLAVGLAHLIVGVPLLAVGGTHWSRYRLQAGLPPGSVSPTFALRSGGEDPLALSLGGVGVHF